MREIPLTQGQLTIVDDEDYDHLIQWKWFASKLSGKYYATRARSGRVGHMFMHREILSAPQKIECDHKNGSTLDNRRENLRMCSTAQNQHNSRKHIDNTSGVKGVDFLNGKWRARISVNGIRKWLGRFSNIEDAAAAREAASKIYHGEFARNS
jgi:hypothetical protein